MDYQAVQKEKEEEMTFEIVDGKRKVFYVDGQAAFVFLPEGKKGPMTTAWEDYLANKTEADAYISASQVPLP